MIVVHALFEVSTTPPGYMKLGSISKEQFLSNENMRFTQVRGVNIDLKYCDTCKIIREPRSFHCSFCGFCILKHGE